ncbi:hypothetical protein P43SY_002246 [Pythium insidiosum]|uniref:histidine kinase n=1 Tax=Pythium insidiosum TaxID=114742 RepID=A0AAD5LQE1_PYTIN|nr:hypothetical protein P43SY_002246 [Pythium insidiosum]
MDALPLSTRHMLAVAATPALALAMDGTVLLWNAHMVSATEWADADVLGRSMAEFIADDTIDEEQSQVEQTGEDRDGNPVEELLARARAAVDELSAWHTQEQLWQIRTARCGIVMRLLVSFSAVGGNAAGETVLVGIGRDVSEKYATAVQRQHVLDSANAPCIAVDMNGCVEMLNRKALEISEYALHEIRGAPLVEQLVADKCREHVSAVLTRALQGQETSSYEFTMMTKTGRRVELLMNATPRFDQKGDVVGVIGIGQDITERVVLEREHTRLIETANAPIFAVDMHYRIVLWNREAATITEYSVDDAMGEDLLSFISHKYRDAVQSALAKAMKGEETANFEFPLITKNGRRLDILLNASPRYDQGGHIVGVFGIGQDITDRRAQEQEYARLIDKANAPIFGVDIDGRVNIWNRKAAHITEYSVFDVLGSKLVEEFIPPDYQTKVGEVLSKAVQGIETANFEFPLITRSGRRVEILLNATPRYDEKGEIIGVVGIGQDITVRIAQEQEYSRLIDTANAPIFGVDMYGQINIWNKKAGEITQYESEDVMGKDLVQQFISEEYRFAVGLVLSKALNGVQTANFNFPLITRTGRRVEILLNATPRYNELGDIVGVVGIGQDITDRIAQEQEYARLIDTANAPIFGVNEEGRVNIWNKKAAEVTQFSTSEVMGENLVEKFITKDYKDAVGSVLSKALSGNETANFEFPLITKSGRRVEILLNATPRFNEHGQVIGVVGIGQDITERIAQEQEYARLIEKANAPIFGVDANGCVNIWNQKTADVTQYTRSEVIGENLVERFISEEYREAAEK